MSLKEDVSTLVVTEKSRLTVSYTMLGTMVAAIVSFFIFINSIATQANQTQKAVDAHLNEVEIRRDSYDKKMQFLMNSVIRLQAERNIRIPRDELRDIEAQ